MKEMITVEKEVYEAVLRNSVRVSDLEAENQQLKWLLKTCREMLKEYQFSEGDFTIGDNLEMDTSLLLKIIDNTIGEKKWRYTDL